MDFIIYKLTNNINGKIYIGQTHNFEARMKSHSRGYNVKSQQHYPLYKAIKKYGWENFSKEIIDTSATTQEELDAQEIKYIELFESSIDLKNGYNVKLGGNSNKHTEYSKKKISLAQVGSKNHMYNKTGVLNPVAIKVKNITTDEIFLCIADAARHDNVNPSKITAVCKGRRGSTGGYVYRYLDENDNIIQPEMTTSQKTKKVRNIETNEVFDSIIDAIKKYGGAENNRSFIGQVCQGKRPSAYGYHWEYV